MSKLSKKTKILLAGVLFLGMIIGALSISEVKAFVFGSEGVVTRWIKTDNIVGLRDETNNVRIGSSATSTLFVDTTNNNIGIGTSTIGSYKLNVAGGDVYIGGNLTTTGTYNTMNLKTSAVGGTLLGVDAGRVNTGDYNTAIGVNTLYSNTTGYDNTAVGAVVLYSNTTGYYNSAIGSGALYSNTTGYYNSAVGANALASNTTGSYNSAVGSFALNINTTGSFNTAVGSFALDYTEGNYNSAVGRQALASNSTGEGNTALGFEAGYGDGTANMQTVVDTYTTFLGYRASRDASIPTSTVLTNITAIGKNSKVAASNSIVLGGTGADAVNVGIGTTSPLANLNIQQTVTAAGALKGIIYTGAVNTNQTLSTEIPSLTLTTAGRQWATGALATQREVLITQPTYSFVGASTITDAATLGIAGAPIKSTNATITNTHGLLIQAGAVSTATNSYGLTVNAQTGATNNYAAAFLGGNVGIGTSDPQKKLDVLYADSSAQLRLSQSTSTYAEFYIDSAGDLRISATGQDIRISDENLWICSGGACNASTTVSGQGNLVLETSLTFENNFNLKKISATSTALYDSTTSTDPIIIFDELTE